MGGSGTARDSVRLVAAPFLVKTYRIVDDPSTDHIVSWGDNNNSFVVWRPKEFSAILLPNYFNHTNFSSFVRQLNTYGFRKIVRGRCEFANKLFKKGQTHLLSHIQRRNSTNIYTGQGSGMDHDKSLNQYSSSTVQNSEVLAVATSLSEENEILRRNNSLLLMEIARLQSVRSRDNEFLSGHNNCNPPLVDMNRSKMENASPSSSITYVAKEISMSPPKLFGVLLC